MEGLSSDGGSLSASRPTSIQTIPDDVLILVSDFLDTHQDLFTFLQLRSSLYKRGKPRLVRPPVHIKTFRSCLSFLSFLMHVPESANFLLELHLNIQKIIFAANIHPRLTQVVRDTLQMTICLVRLEVSTAHTWHAILPASAHLPQTLEELILREVDIHVFSWMTEAAAYSKRLTILHAHFVNGPNHIRLADSLQPLSGSTTLRDVTLDGRFHSFDAGASTTFPSVRRLSFGFTRYPSTNALFKAFPHLTFLQLIPRCWYPLQTISHNYSQENINAQVQGIWKSLDTLWGTPLSLNLMAVRAPVCHLALEFLDSTPIDQARYLVERYKPSKLTFSGTHYFFLAFEKGAERVRDSFGPEARGIESLRGIAFALSDPYVLFYDKDNRKHIMLVVYNARVPYFEIAYIRDKPSTGAPPPDDASIHALEDLMVELVSRCPALRLLGLETLDRGMLFWEVGERDMDVLPVITMLSREDGETFRDSLLGGEVHAT